MAWEGEGLPEPPLRNPQFKTIPLGSRTASVHTFPTGRFVTVVAFAPKPQAGNIRAWPQPCRSSVPRSQRSAFGLGYESLIGESGGRNGRWR